MHDIDKAIAFGNCIGCGVCAFAYPEQYKINISSAGHLKAECTLEHPTTDASTLCPMTGASANETEIAQGLFPDLPSDNQVGKYRSAFAASVNVGSYRDLGGSGGLVSWLAVELLERNLIDAVIHVKPANIDKNNPLMFRYGVSSTADEVMKGAKSRYYPVEMSDVLSTIQKSPRRYLIIGLPCFIKGIRLLQNEGILSALTVPYTIGLVCGHLKSKYFADYLALQKDAELGSLVDFNFRHKLENRKASDYGFAFRTEDAPNVLKGPWPMLDVKGKDWGEGQFKNTACEFCDDVLAECADIVIGDAWLPGYVDDYQGTNIVVTRNNQLDAILREAAEYGALKLDEVTISDVVKSQASGLRHRREGLAHRLKRRKNAGVWIPAKRVKPALSETMSRRGIYDLRMKIAQSSAQTFADVRALGGSPAQYERRMARYILLYKLVIRASSFLKKINDRLRISRTARR